jgi:type I restriction enzyme S subunit
MTRLKYVARLVPGGTPSTSDPRFWAEGDDRIPWVSIGDMTRSKVVRTTARLLTSEGLASRRLPLGEPGTVLFAMYASVGALAVLGVQGSWNQAILGVMALPDKAERRFLAYWLESLRPRLTGLFRSNTQDNLNAEQVGALPFPVVPLQVQSTISDFLDVKISRIDALAARKRLLLKLVEERRDRRLDRVALPGLGRVNRSRPSDPLQREEVPSNCAIVPVGHLLKRITYGFTNPMPVNDVGPYMLTANDISDGRILYETARRTTDEAFRTQLSAKSRPVPGDILLTKDGSLGRVALFDGTPACVNQSVAVLSPDVKRVMPECLALLLTVPAYRDALIFEAGGTTIKHLYSCFGVCARSVSVCRV